MSAISKIQWTDRTWNPVRGCSIVSPGCVNCYAMKQAHRFSGEGRAYRGLTKQTKAGPQWTGSIRTVEDALLEPLSWRKPQRVFVNSMSDLFHEGVPDEFIAKVFETMAQARRHTFQVLTKRADRMREIVKSLAAQHTSRDGSGWPLPNVWLGVSAEDQQRADERIPLLLQTPAAVRFVSAEPLLGPIDFAELPSRYEDKQYGDANRPLLRLDALRGGHRCGPASFGPDTGHLDWVIVGGESGPGARLCDQRWIGSIVEQCKAAGVSAFVKQMGSKSQWLTHCPFDDVGLEPAIRLFKDRKGGDPSEWPADLRVREFPAVSR